MGPGGVEIGHVESCRDFIHVAAKHISAVVAHGKENRFAAGGVELRALQARVGQRWRDFAVVDAAQRGRPGDGLVLERLKEQLGCGAEGVDVRIGVTVGDAETREYRQFFQRIADECRDPFTVLIVILGKVGTQADFLAVEQRSLLGLIEIEPAIENGEAAGDGLLEQVGLGEAELELPLDQAELRG